MALAVHLNRPPNAGFLLAWGRHPTGWWGCVAMKVRLVDVHDELDVAAWIPAQALTRPHWTGDRRDPDVTRLALPENDAAWPAPPRWPSWYAGVWASGQLRLPPGAVMVTGAAWRNRPPRGRNRPTPG